MLLWHSQLSSPPKAHYKDSLKFGGLDGNAIEDVFIHNFVWDNRWHMYLIARCVFMIVLMVDFSSNLHSHKFDFSSHT